MKIYIEISNWKFKLNIGIENWNWTLESKIEMGNLIWKCKPNIEFENWNWKLKLNIKNENLNSNFELKIEIKSSFEPSRSTEMSSVQKLGVPVFFFTITAAIQFSILIFNFFFFLNFWLLAIR